MEKTFTYEKGKVTVHGIENWSPERLAPLLTEYVSAAINGKEDEKNVA